MKQICRRMMRFPANKNPVCQLNKRKKIIECSISSSFPFFLFVVTCHCIFPLLLHFFLLSEIVTLSITGFFFIG